MEMFQQNQRMFFFLLLVTSDCKGWPLSNESHSYLREFKFCLRDREVFMLPWHFWVCGSQGTALPLDLFFPPAELLSMEP